MPFLPHTMRDRRQRVVVSGEESAWSAVSSGVPQGSIIGPLLFINDLDEKMTSTVLKFADDTKLSSNSQQELQRDLDTAVVWAHTWQMQFNMNKCKVMHVGHRNERAIYNMGNHRLEEVEEEKDLRPHLEYCSLVWSPYLKKDILSKFNEEWPKWFLRSRP